MDCMFETRQQGMQHLSPKMSAQLEETSAPARPPVEPSTGGMPLCPPVPRTAISQVSYPFSEVPITAIGCTDW